MVFKGNGSIVSFFFSLYSSHKIQGQTGLLIPEFQADGRIYILPPNLLQCIVLCKSLRQV